MKKIIYPLSVLMCLAGGAGIVAAKPADLRRPALSRKLDKTVKGTVKDDKGEALPGVSVVIQGTTRGSLTDEKGNFTLSVPDEAATLIFSFVGYVQQQVKLGNQSVVDIVLLADTKSLEEFVVVGGTVPRRKATLPALYRAFRRRKYGSDRFKT